MTKDILSTIGKTPLVKLSRYLPGAHFDLYAKLEGFNPGGSIKDRTAYYILTRALESGRARPGSTVIESSSGNMGIGLAQACAFYGLRFICVVDSKTTKQNVEILRAYGAQIDKVEEPDPVSGEFLQARLNRVRQLLREIPGSVWFDQYSNEHNPLAHYETMREILDELDGRLDYLFCATSTCGTLRGCSEYLRSRGAPTKVVAVDAVGSVIFGGGHCKRLIPGHGAALVPQLFRPDLSDGCVHVTDLDCVKGCRRLMRREAVLAGGSSGGVLSAVERMNDLLPHGAVCVAILPDRGERYLDTIYSDEWVRDHFGEVSHLWEGAEEARECVRVGY
jgi:2,3-diaminopropionate biosynthesis protein SbnA